MGKFLLKDQSINLNFSHFDPNTGGKRHGSKHTAKFEVFKPRHGQKYAKAKLPIDIRRFQKLLPAATTSTENKSENIYFTIYFLCPMSNNRGSDHEMDTVRLFGSPLDQLLVHNKDLKLKVDVLFDQNFVANEMVAAYDSNGRCYFENTIRPETYFAPLSAYSGISGRLNIELVGLPVSMGAVSDLQSTNQKLLEEKRFTDFALVAKNGQKIPCLRAFLATTSPVFDRMLQSDCKETKEAACKLDISEEGVKALLNYIYCKNTEVPSETAIVALELLKTADKYDISGLEAAMKAIILSKPVGWLTVDVALLLFIHSEKLEGYQELKRKAVKAIKSKKNDLEESQFFDELIQDDPKLTKKLFVFAL